MCNNKPYNALNPENLSEDEKKERIRVSNMGQYSAGFLQGKTIEDIAKLHGVSEEEVIETMEGIKDINPYLYNQLQKAKAAREAN